VDVERFERDLPALFDDFPRSPEPRVRRFADVLEAVPGLARENNLALVNLAASLVPEGESYVEVGTFRGTSLISALRGNDRLDAVAVDDFSFRDGSRELLEENLARFGLAGRPTILEGDFRQVLGGDALADRRVGVYYYDAGHTYEEQLAGLRLIEPHLADGALLIVDDSDWERVERADRDYLASQPRARLLFDIPGDDKGFPHWWKGVHVIAWDAS
jgi:predicted O-methyltransferase YrrM